MLKICALFIFGMISVARSELVISEFLAANDSILADEDGDFSDWIEILNEGDEAVDLAGHFLTDDTTRLDRWEFPSVILEMGERLVVFASNKNRDVGELHTNFRLSSQGEYLALVAPGGVVVLSDFGEEFPPQFGDISYGVGEAEVGYFDLPTPGEMNGAVRLPGPQFGEVRTGGERPGVGVPLVITAQVEGADEVILYYRVGFESAEVSAVMGSVDGVNFSTTIPGAGPGSLIRWRFEATDSAGVTTSEPVFADAENSHQYHGVPVINDEVESNAEVLEWFVSNEGAASLEGFPIEDVRGGVYFLGEYYDNVGFSLHGQSSLFFRKRSFNIDFNRTQRFRWREGEALVGDINLITNWTDKAKLRQEMAYEILRESGVPTHFAFTVRVQRNGDFYSLADIIEDADEVYLERAGLDEEGALYKVDASGLEVSDIDQAGGVRASKETRRDEDNSDLDEMIRGINGVFGNKWDYIYDHIDFPKTINALAGMAVIKQTDMGVKNYYVYRETTGDGEWAILPWDLDLTFGRNFVFREAHFDTTLFSDPDLDFSNSAQAVSLVRFLLNENAATRAMFFRRVQTLSDRFIMSDYIPERTTAQLQRLSPNDIFPGDALLDSFAWGTWHDGNFVPQPFTTTNPDSESMEQAVSRLVDDWLVRWRVELSQNSPDLPGVQLDPQVMIGGLDFDPISDDQDQEYFELINQSPMATDVSGWSVEGAVRFTLPDGTVIPSGGSLYLSPDVNSFRERDLSPTGNEQRFVVGPYDGNLSSDGETIYLLTPEGVVADQKTYSGSEPGFNGNASLDQDGDGLIAIVEWAIGTSDQIRNELPLPTSRTLDYEVRNSLNGFVLEVEFSDDLETWSVAEVIETNRTPLSDQFDLVSVSFPPVVEGARDLGFVRYVLRRELE